MFNCKSLLLLLLITLYLNNIQSQGDIDFETSEINRLTQLLEELSGENKFPILLELAEKTLPNDAESAAMYMKQAAQWIDENKHNKNLFLYYKSLSSVKLAQNQFLESISLAEKASQFDLPDINPIVHIEIFKNIGKAIYTLGENDKAQQAFFKSLRVADSLHVDNEIAEISNAIGVVYTSMADYEMAEKYYVSAIEIAKDIEDETIYSKAIENLAIAYIRTEKYDEAERIIIEQIAKHKSKGVKSKSKLGINYNNLSLIYYKQHKYYEAIKYIKKALDIAYEIDDPYSIAMRNCNLGEFYGEINNYKLATAHLDIGLELAKNIDNKEIYNYGIQQAAEMYEKFGKHEKALDYFKQYSSLKDTMLNEKRIQVVAEVEEKYEAAKKELEIISLSGKNVKAQNELKLLRYLIFGLSFGLLGFIGFVYFIRQNHKKNLIIQNKNLKIASDKIEILEKSKEITKLSSLIKGQEYERERLAKEMHDGLGGLLAISHSKLANLTAKNEVNIVTLEESKNLVGEAYNQVRQISHNLMPMDLEKFGLVPTLKNMIGLINNQNSDISIDFRTYNFDLALDNELGLNIYRIVQEAITNILKYAQAKNVLIELIQHEHHFSLSIEDDGIGLDMMNYKSGIGIQNMKNRSELFSGSFDLESKLDVGTSIFVQIPLPVRSITQNQI